jgi:triosephosphate isomerase
MAIGTGETASSQNKHKEMHKFIRETVHYGIRKRYRRRSIHPLRSVKPENAKNFSKPDVDGGLIGGAALKSDDFAIVNAI